MAQTQIRPNSIGESLQDFSDRAWPHGVGANLAARIWRDFADAFKVRNVGKWDPYMPGGRTAQEAGRIENMRGAKVGP